MSGQVSQDDRVPEQAAVLAVRHIGEQVEVCLIRRINSGTWGIPKGMIDPGDTPEDAALKEAWEEAGIMGN